MRGLVWLRATAFTGILIWRAVPFREREYEREERRELVESLPRVDDINVGAEAYVLQFYDAADASDYCSEISRHSAMLRPPRLSARLKLQFTVRQVSLGTSTGYLSIFSLSITLASLSQQCRFLVPSSWNVSWKHKWSPWHTVWAESMENSGDMPFRLHEHVYQTIDATQQGDTPWQCLVVSYNGEASDPCPSW